MRQYKKNLAIKRAREREERIAREEKEKFYMGLFSTQKDRETFVRPAEEAQPNEEPSPTVSKVKGKRHKRKKSKNATDILLENPEEKVRLNDDSAQQDKLFSVSGHSYIAKDVDIKTVNEPQP